MSTTPLGGILMLYLTRNELCEFYQVKEEELNQILKAEKQLGTIFYHEDILDGLGHNDYLAVVLPIMGEVIAQSFEKLPLLPFPVPKLIYEAVKLDEEYLVLTLARYKISHLRGDFSQDITLDTTEFQRSIVTVLHDYDYLNPYQGKILYWIDLKTELCALVDNLPLERIDDIVAHGRRIRVIKRTFGN